MLRGRQSRAAFTMVELMVVIMIILLLAGMTIVGLSRAHKTAQQTYCLQNLRQIGSTIITYTNVLGGGYLPDFSIDMERKAREEWVMMLDFIKKEDLYVGVQELTKIVPPRASPPVLRCPGDVHLFVNTQSILTSYWMHPNNSLKLYASITNRDETMLGFEGDPVYIMGTCNCRFVDLKPPEEVDTTHFGGGNILFANGSVKLYTEPEMRKLLYWEEKAGWK